MDGNEQNGNSPALEYFPHDGCSTGGKLLRPAKCDDVRVGLLGGRDDLVFATADTQLKPDLSDPPWAVARDELVAPRPGFVLRLIRERR
jgi:hypothetical protein